MNIREIARLANVSIATVSRVMNRPEVVLPETREHVLAVMKQYSYQPAITYAEKAKQYLPAILLLVPNSGSYLHQRLMQGIESVAKRREYTVFLSNMDNEPQEAQRVFQLAANQKMAGIVMVSSHLADESVYLLKSLKLPVVIIGKGEQFSSYNTCYVNFEEGAYRMVRHLLNLGHRRIGLMCDKQDAMLENYMQSGYQRAVQDGGGELSETALVYRCENSIQGGYSAYNKQIISEMPDAIFCSSDEIAIGLIEALQANGLNVPEDIAVTGFSDSPAAGAISPKLTTVEQPTHKLGIVAARMLFDLLDDDFQDDVPQEIVLLPKLKIRNSCGNKKPINIFFE